MKLKVKHKITTSAMEQTGYIYTYIYEATSISNTVAQVIIFKPDVRLQKPKERGMAWVKSSHWEKKGSLVEMCSELSSMRKW